MVRQRKAKKASLVTEHYNIDADFKMRPDPMLHHDKNVARDLHDVFNLIYLVPVVAMNVANWKFELSTNIPEMWHGEYFVEFWWTTASYFAFDVIFVAACPNCVRSPEVIIKHHIVTLGYMCLSLWFRGYEWIVGSCLIVEINTWLLIARRFFNRAGDKPFFSIGVPFTKSLRIKLISVGFYLTWFFIRIILYPALLFPVCQAYAATSKLKGTYLNALAVAPVFHLVFILLNFKWTVDLVRSKLKQIRRGSAPNNAADRSLTL